MPQQILTLAAGDTLDFAVGYGPSHVYYNDMTGLAALLAPRPPRLSALPQPRRVVARRQRRVTRVTLQSLLELLHPLRQRS